MRDMPALVGVIFVIAAVGAIGYFGFRPVVGGSHASTPATEAAATSPVSAQKSENNKQKRVELRRRPPPTNAEVAIGEKPAPAVPPVATTVPDVPRVPPPFPVSRDIASGISRSQLRAEFGPPQLRVLATSRGQLTEKYVYIKPDRSAITIAYLENGAVVSAESMTQ